MRPVDALERHAPGKVIGSVADGSEGSYGDFIAHQ